MIVLNLNLRLKLPWWFT